jgi:2-phospho-L-lactate guanylyltransferase
MAYCCVPVKRLKNAKSRLASILDEEQRARLSLTMLEDVLDSLILTNIKKIFVVCSDKKVKEIALSYSAEVVGEPEKVMNSRVNAAFAKVQEVCNKDNVGSILYIPADVPLIVPNDVNFILSMAKERRCVVIAPSREADGTNALLLKPCNVIKTWFDMNSFENHVKEAKKGKIALHFFLSKSISLDIDTIEDLRLFMSKESDTKTYRLLVKILGKDFSKG